MRVAEENEQQDINSEEMEIYENEENSNNEEIEIVDKEKEQDINSEEVEKCIIWKHWN